MLCCRCKEERDVTYFTKSTKRKSGYYPVCKICCKQYREDNKDRLKEYSKEYRKRNLDILKKKSNDYYAKNRDRMLSSLRERLMSNRESAMLYKVRERALQEGWEINITKEDLVIPEVCPYLEIPITRTLGKGQLESNSSVDRIDSSKGYIKGNVQVISRKANTMKNNATKEELITFAKNVLKMYGETN